MKFIFTVSLVLSIGATLFSQEETFLEHNNVRAIISNTGTFFNDGDMSASGYEYPKNAENHLIYASSFWFGAVDGEGNLKMAAQLWGGEEEKDFFPGALKTDGTAEAVEPAYADEIYRVSASEISYHIANYAADGYVAPDGITNWPGNGDVTLGMDSELAPFSDLNGNGIYEPELGEYPKIRGDHAVYLILNDAAWIHTASGGNPLGIEIHYMFYQYNTDDYLNNTTFVNVRVINRSSNDYPEFIVGNFMDADIGASNDDYIGSNEEHNVIFAYNGALEDPPHMGRPGYGDNPPAYGLVSLNHPMHVGGYFENAGGPYGMPNTAMDFWNYMNGRWKNSLEFRYGGNGNTTAGDSIVRYLYSGYPTGTEDEWTETNVGNPEGDRRMFMASDVVSFDAGESLCFDYAIVIGDEGGDPFENAAQVIDLAGDVKEFYDLETGFYCDFTLGLPTEEDVFDVQLYPNPSNGSFSVSAEGTYTVEIFSVDGRQVFRQGQNSDVTTFQADLTTGTYITVITQNEKRYIAKLIIE